MTSMIDQLHAVQERGGAVAPTLTQIAVSNTVSTSLLGANANRRGLIIQNVGANPVTIDLAGGAVSLGVGLILNPAPAGGQAGGALVLDGSAIPATGITALAATAATTVTVYEF